MQMLFDCTEADPHFSGNLLLRDPIDPHRAKSEGRAFGQCVEDRVDAPKLVSSDQQAIGRWLGVAGGCDAPLDVALRPLLLARGAALCRTTAVQHQIFGGPIKISEGFGN
ncbi:MAG: hypothetical protein ABS88_01890 [Sphingopyxis sp. SCN 67-31]|nr:MAG: hypothetical protein ABS88_01890 [Sphingopyxis sp. SCN 67-31]